MQEEVLEEILRCVEKPARYTGGEVNMIVKDPARMRVRFAFAFPDTYEVGMSHLGGKILYEVMNRPEDVYCERVYAPWPDMERQLRDRGLKLFSLETHTPLCAFDMVGFALSYEMSYTNMLNMLDLAGIPLRSADRGAKDPIVVAGGPCVYNPEPIAPFVDAFIIGEGEEVNLELIELYKQYKGLSKEAFLRHAAQIEGIYVPRFYETDAFGAVHPKEGSGAPARVRKRIVSDMDTAVYPTAPIVPFLSVVHDRMMMEVFRACTRGCRFCQAGMIYRPLREKSMERILELAKAQSESTGYEELSLTSLSTGDYSNLHELEDRLDEMLCSRRVSVSLPSLRIDSFGEDMARQSSAVRKTGLTFAPEAGSQRLRDVINKNVTEEDLLRCAKIAFENGYSRIKLYFMIGLPTETQEDLQELADLAHKVADVYYAMDKKMRAPGLNIVVSTSTFVPKPDTPFQWCAQVTQEQILEKQQFLRQALRRRGISYSWHESKCSQLEACFAVGDGRMADVLERAFMRGCRFDGWDEHFKYDTWMQAFDDCGLRVEDIANRAKDEDAPLCWDHIDCGVTREYMRREWEKAKEGKTTRDCRKGCNACGADCFKAGGCV